MKIFVFEFANYFSYGRSFKVLANNRDEAWNILISDKDIHHYIMDDETTQTKEYEIELDKPMIISHF